MEKQGDSNSNNKQRKIKGQISFSGGGGGNIGGIVLWGGALAVAGLAAAFAVKRGGGRRSPRTTKKDDLAGQGLRLVLRNSSPTFQSNPCCTSNGSTTKLVAKKISSCEADSTKSLILVEKTSNCSDDNVISGNQEEEDLREDEIKSCKNHTMIEEFSFPMPDHPSSQLTESRIEDDLADKFPLLEEEKEVDVLNESTDKTLSIHSASAEEPQKNDLADKFPLMDEEEEVDVLNASTDKSLSIQSASAEEEQRNDINDKAIKEIRLAERIEAWKEEEPFDNGLKTSEYLTSEIHSVEKEGCGDDNDDVDLNIAESIEEPLYASKIDSNKTSSEHSMGEGDKETVKESMLIENIKILEKDAENYGVSNMSTKMTSVKHLVEEDDDEEEEDEDEEDIVEKAEENSEETESTSAGSNAEEIWPEEAIEALSQELKNSLQYSLAKTAEDQTISSEDCSSNFDNRKTSKLKNCIDDYQTAQTPTLLKKEESEFAMANDQPKSVTNWTNLNWVRHMLLLALMVVVFFFTHHSAIYLFP
ncbi:uncharacterized protein LOC126686982 [Mercurialis annua]|uniref:uncharacterized protein LOC126686982 n=1 Tax=Mercurialis annua TaxID=3986 RepID=UPI00215DF89E|nr:uncharacterized protein LOC126686982 [Mercurialis annua]